MEYDKNNIFARILRKEIPADIIYEDEYALAFHDVNPQAPIHVLVIPKKEYVSFFDFAEKASPEFVYGFTKAIHHVIKSFDLRKDGFRILSNHSVHGGQEVPHFHFHIFGGRPLGRMLTPP
ncbi:MAG: HIT domain-containing protein [Alphaproteobacteria bacterium]|nr:HIT domain-containing protein [Alphaproteobacteria bacterium]